MIVWDQGGWVDDRRRVEASSDNAGGESPPQEGAQHHGGGDLLESASELQAESDCTVQCDCTEWTNVVHPVSCKLLYLKVIVRLVETCIASQAGCLVKGDL